MLFVASSVTCLLIFMLIAELALFSAIGMCRLRVSLIAAVKIAIEMDGENSLGFENKVWLKNIPTAHSIILWSKSVALGNSSGCRLYCNQRTCHQGNVFMCCCFR